VLASRLSEDTHHNVVLLKAGHEPTNLLTARPMENLGPGRIAVGGENDQWPRFVPIRVFFSTP
jgi:hypothetical protein